MLLLNACDAQQSPGPFDFTEPNSSTSTFVWDSSGLEITCNSERVDAAIAFERAMVELQKTPAANDMEAMGLNYRKPTHTGSREVDGTQQLRYDFRQLENGRYAEGGGFGFVVEACSWQVLQYTFISE